jgi:hypothetical protein
VPDKVYNVLFLCNNNSARSIMAEAILNRHGAGNFRAAGEPCPVGPGQPITAHWGIPEPCAAAGSEAEIAVAFDETFGMFKRCIDLFLALAIVKLDRLAHISHLKEIGRAEGATAKAKAVHGC